MTLQTISETEFLHNLINGYPVKDFIIERDLPDGNSQRTIMKIENCTFLDNCTLPSGGYDEVTIKNCTFNKAFTLHDISNNNIEITECIFQDSEILLSNIGQSSKVNISNNRGIKKLEIRSGRVVDIKIKNNEVHEIVINPIQGNPMLEIDDVYEFEKGTNKKIKSTIINLSCVLHKTTISNSSIDNFEINSDPTQSASQFILVELHKNEINSVNVLTPQLRFISFDQCKIKSLNFNETVSDEIKLISSNCDKIKFHKNINALKFNRSNKDTQKDCKIAHLDMESINCNDLSITSTSIDILNMNGTTIPEEKLKFNFVTIVKQLFLEHISFSKAKFHNVNFQQAEIRFHDSSLPNAELINVRWPKNYEIYEYENDLKKEDITPKQITDKLWSLKESYRQLKVLSLSQQNKIDAISFQKQELKIYWMIVDKDFCENWKVSWFDTVKNSGNWLILWTHKAASDFGVNIWRPLRLLLIFHFIFFFILMLSQSGLDYELTWNCKEWTRGAFIDGLGDYLYTLSPVHTAKIGKGQVPIQPIIDFFMRIFAGYFIFYFITANRKYHQ